MVWEDHSSEVRQSGDKIAHKQIIAIAYNDNHHFGHSFNPAPSIRYAF